MRYLDEYRSPQRARRLLDEIRAAVTGPHVIMEICGGQTHAIVRYGIDQLLPAQISLVHGPGCPVCVTPVELVDKAIEIASRPEVIFCSFGDMLRVPGHDQDLLMVKAAGGDVRIVYSPLDALRLARENPDRQVVFFAVGFETTAPGNAMAVYQAHRQGIENFSLLVSHVLVPPAMRAILASPENRVQGFLAAGHVCAVMGVREYEPIAAEFRVPIVVTGLSPWISCRASWAVSGNWNRDGARSRIPTAARSVPTAIRPRGISCGRSSRWGRANGGGSARSRKAAWSCGDRTRCTMPSSALGSRIMSGPKIRPVRAA